MAAEAQLLDEPEHTLLVVAVRLRGRTHGQAHDLRRLGDHARERTHDHFLSLPLLDVADQPDHPARPVQAQRFERRRPTATE